MYRYIENAAIKGTLEALCRAGKKGSDRMDSLLDTRYIAPVCIEGLDWNFN